MKLPSSINHDSIHGIPWHSMALWHQPVRTWHQPFLSLPQPASAAPPPAPPAAQRPNSPRPPSPAAAPGRSAWNPSAEPRSPGLSGSGPEIHGFLGWKDVKNLSSMGKTCVFFLRRYGRSILKLLGTIWYHLISRGFMAVDATQIESWVFWEIIWNNLGVSYFKSYCEPTKSH